MTLVWRTVDPNLLYPPFTEAVIQVFEGCPHRFVVTHGYRSLEEQAALYAAYEAYKRRGMTPPVAGRAAPAGKSAHNYGCAVDVVLDANPATPGLEPTWVTTLAGWQWLLGALRAHPLLNHGWWFGDWPHIEWRHWKQVARLNQEAST